MARRRRAGCDGAIDDAALDLLVRDHLPLVRTTVAQAARQVPRHVDRDDLVAAGMEGLVHAARSFDPTRGVSFEHHARLRIRGAVLDELRRRDVLDRGLRGRARRVSAATEALTARLGRTPILAEVASESELQTIEVAELRACLERAALWDPRGMLGPTDEPCGIDVADDAVGPDSVIVENELRAGLGEAVAALPERLRRVVVGHVSEGRAMKDLAAELGVSAARASQLCREGISQLRGTLASRALA